MIVGEKLKSGPNVFEVIDAENVRCGCVEFCEAIRGERRQDGQRHDNNEEFRRPEWSNLFSHQQFDSWLGTKRQRLNALRRRVSAENFETLQTVGVSSSLN